MRRKLLKKLAKRGKKSKKETFKTIFCSFCVWIFAWAYNEAIKPFSCTKQCRLTPKLLRAQDPHHFWDLPPMTYDLFFLLSNIVDASQELNITVFHNFLLILRWANTCYVVSVPKRVTLHWASSSLEDRCLKRCLSANRKPNKPSPPAQYWNSIEFCRTIQTLTRFPFPLTSQRPWAVFFCARVCFPPYACTAWIHYQC